MVQIMKQVLRHGVVQICLLLALLIPVLAQHRDHLTEEEVEMVREMQEIDQRIAVFVKAADRRLLVLADPNAIQKKKEEEVWGPLPKGTRIELLTDYKRILEEAEEKMEDAFERSGKNEKLPKALAKFKEAVTRHIAQLRALAPQFSDPKEQRVLAEAIEEAETVTKGSLK
jgi:hypothetical protein